MEPETAAMNEQVPAETLELRCVECERPVIMERWLSDPPQVICTDCEEKINDAFWEALHA